MTFGKAVDFYRENSHEPGAIHFDQACMNNYARYPRERLQDGSLATDIDSDEAANILDTSVVVLAFGTTLEGCSIQDEGSNLSLPSSTNPARANASCDDKG